MGASSLGSGLWVSDDTCKSWKQLGWKHGKTYSLDVYKASNGKLIFLARGDGLQRSTDGGETWKVVTNWLQTEVMDVAIDQTNPALLYIATANGMWKSLDTGNTFVTSGLGFTSSYISSLKFNPIYPNRMAAATEKGVFISQDRGDSWRALRAEIPVPSSTVHYSTEGRLFWGGDDGTLKAERMLDVVNKDELLDRLWVVEDYESRIIAGGTKGLFEFTIMNKGDKVSSERVDEEIKAVPSAPDNIHALLRVGNILFAGSLDKGLWRYDLSKSSEGMQQISFPRGQVWSLKAFEIE